MHKVANFAARTIAQKRNLLYISLLLDSVISNLHYFYICNRIDVLALKGVTFFVSYICHSGNTKKLCI